jgi:hypothetical protein
VPLGDVAEQVARLDEVVARVHVAGVLEGQRQAAGLAMHAQARSFADPVRERRVEHLHVDLAHVAPDPVLEDVDEEATVALGRHRSRGHAVSTLLIQRPVAP